MGYAEQSDLSRKSSPPAGRSVPDSAPSRRIRYDLAVLLLALAIIGGQYLLSYDEPFDEIIYDEIGFAHVGAKLLSAGIFQGNFSGSLWWEDDGQCGSSNPRVGVYILGALHRLAANRLPGGRNEQTYIAYMRLFMALLSVACVYVFFRFTVQVLPVRWALLAVLLLLINPVFRWVNVSVITDSPMLLFSLLAMCYAVKIPSNSTITKRRTRYWVLTGLFIGLAVSSKLYALSLGAALAYLAFWQISVKGWRQARYALLAAGTVVLVFFATNPLLWWDPLYGLNRMTVGHMASLTGGLIGEFYEGLAALVRHTLTWFAWERYGRGGSFGTLGQWLLCLPALALLAAGTRNFRQAQTVLLWVFFLGNLALAAYVAVGFGQSLYTPKLALLPTVAAIPLGVKGAAELVRRYADSGGGKDGR